MARNEAFAGNVTLESSLVFLFVSTSTSDVPTAGDSTPTGTCYDGASAMGVTVTVAAVSGKTGVYSVTIACMGANAFAANANYSVYLQWEISSSARGKMFYFNVT